MPAWRKFQKTLSHSGKRTSRYGSFVYYNVSMATPLSSTYAYPVTCTFVCLCTTCSLTQRRPVMSSVSTSESRKLRGFTAVELLVVIAIIGILIAISAASGAGGARNRTAAPVHKQSATNRNCLAQLPRRSSDVSTRGIPAVSIQVRTQPHWRWIPFGRRSCFPTWNKPRRMRRSIGDATWQAQMFRMLTSCRYVFRGFAAPQMARTPLRPGLIAYGTTTQPTPGLAP